MNQAMQRRLRYHDYNGRGIYMLTFSTIGRKAVLGRLVCEGGDFSIAPTALGNCVADEIRDLTMRYPQIKVLDYIIMPGHVHLLLFVQEQMPQHLGRVVASLKAKCSQAWWRLQEVGDTQSGGGGVSGTLKRTAPDEQHPVGDRQHPTQEEGPARPVGGTLVPPITLVPPAQPPLRRPSLWEPGYHDRYLMRQGQLQTLHNYIHDNPRRLGIKRMRPDLFRVRQHLRIGTREYASMGNIFLLKRADKQQVFMHRRATADEIQHETVRLMACCERGAVLVTPGISPGEKAIVHAAIEQGWPLILLRENGFAEYEKPHGRYFEACANGALLLLSPWEYHTDRHTISRTQCLSLNDQSSECHHVYMDGRVVMVEDNVNDMARTICDSATTFALIK